MAVNKSIVFLILIFMGNLLSEAPKGGEDGVDGYLLLSLIGSLSTPESILVN